MIVVEYSEAFRAKMVRKMLPPGAVSAYALAAETGMNQPTLSRWLKEARSVGVMDKRAKKWTAAEKLRVVVEASKLKDAELGELLRREGVHEAQLNAWRTAAEESLSDTPRPKKNKKSPEAMRIKELERELRRKEKALAEAAAIIVLKKKARALGLLGDVDDDTMEDNEQ